MGNRYEPKEKVGPDTVPPKLQFISWRVPRWPFRAALTWGQSLRFVTLHIPVTEFGLPQGGNISLDKELPSAQAVLKQGWQLKAISGQHPCHLRQKSFISKGECGWYIVASTTVGNHEQSWIFPPNLHRAVLSWGMFTALAHKINEQMLLSFPISLLSWHFSFLCIFRRPTSDVLCFLSFYVVQINIKIGIDLTDNASVVLFSMCSSPKNIW